MFMLDLPYTLGGDDDDDVTDLDGEEIDEEGVSFEDEDDEDDFNKESKDENDLYDDDGDDV